MNASRGEWTEPSSRRRDPGGDDLERIEIELNPRERRMYDVLREKEYAKGLDKRIKEAYRKDVHPRYNGAQRAATRQLVVDEFERVEMLYPKV